MFSCLDFCTWHNFISCEDMLTLLEQQQQQTPKSKKRTHVSLVSFILVYSFFPWMVSVCTRRPVHSFTFVSQFVLRPPRRWPPEFVKSLFKVYAVVLKIYFSTVLLPGLKPSCSSASSSSISTVLQFRLDVWRSAPYAFMHFRLTPLSLCKDLDSWSTVWRVLGHFTCPSDQMVKNYWQT